MALTQKLDNINWSLIFERPKKNRRERREGEKKKKRKRKRRRREAKKKGMDFYDFWYGIIWIPWISCINICLWVVGCRKSNPRMNSCMEIITNPFVFLGFCYEGT